MIFVSHRGNTEGPNPELENLPEQILKVLKEGFNVEIDLWSVDNKLYLGHDTPDYLIDTFFLTENKNKLWCHAKNKEALEYLLTMSKILNGFWHERDTYTITTSGFGWIYPKEPLIKNSIYVMIEHDSKFISTILNNDYSLLGICSDYIAKYKTDYEEY